MNFKKYKSWWFLLVIILSYVILYFITPTKIDKAIKMFISILSQIWYIFIMIFVIMIVLNYFLNAKNIAKHINGKNKIKIWIIIIITGILSSGPIYMWFPLLKDLKDKGIKNKYLVAFLYNRAIKIPLLPIIAIYFSLKYVIVLTIVMIIVSIIQGIIVEKIIDR
jgi:uncharacterized membrane protein YraQ (UPF0718 family)